MLEKVSLKRAGRFFEKKSILQKFRRDKRPNIILIITDDQDIELGSMNVMPKTLKLLKQRGVEFKHAFVSTPICKWKSV